MLERIQRITGVGLYNDDRPAAHAFKKLTLIYGDNGRGKTTLASILRSYNDNAASTIISRKTINTQNNQVVELLFSEGNRSVFTTNTWSAKYDSCHIFDLDFIDKNVYSGGEIKPAQRKNLLTFALGNAAVIAMQDLKSASELSSQATANVRETENKLLGYRGTKTVSQYKRENEEQNREQRITDIDVKLTQASNFDVIRNKNIIPKLDSISIDLTEIFSVINRNISSINDAVSQLVNEHIANINHDGIEQWLSDGQSFSKDGKCPFCAQNTTNVELVNAYRSYFNQEVKDHLTAVQGLTDKKISALQVINIQAIEQKYNNIIQSRDYWKDHIVCEEISSPLDYFRELKASLQTSLETAISAKLANPYETVQAEYENESNEFVIAFNQKVTELNEIIERCNLKIADFKNTLENVNVEDLTAEKLKLEKNKIRYSADVIALIDEWDSLKAIERNTKDEKDDKKEILNGIMTQTLGQYEESINALLSQFGASFRIKQIAYNYNGTGEPRTEYVLELRGKDLKLQGDDADFRTYLSEGDKRTLAFAFFISVVQADIDLVNKIVVIDDPMCSFDYNRKHQTITILKNIFSASKQLIVMAHDIYFIKKIRDEFIKASIGSDLSEIKVSHTGGGFSKLVKLDLDKECESMYYKNHRVVSEYIEGEGGHNERDVAVAIRPLLEGYLHRRFPNTLTPELLFGQIVQLISNSDSASPLHHAKPLILELNQLNAYAGTFHHDTNPNFASAPVVPGELITFCERALHVVHKGY